MKNRLVLWQSRRDLLLLALAVAYFMVCMFTVSLANAAADREAIAYARSRSNGTSSTLNATVLPDALMDVSRDWFVDSKIPHDISDTLVKVAAGVAILRAVTMGRQSSRVLRQLFFLAGTVFAFRALCVWVIFSAAE
jgi:hypothetical protein